MLSEKVKEYLKEKGLYDETEDTDYQEVMSKLGIEKTKVKFDINEFLLSMLLKDAKTKINGASTTSALTCEETKTPSEEDMLDLALGIGLTLSSKKLQLKMLGALAEAIKKLFKIDSGKIDAVLNVYLEQIYTLYYLN